MIAEAMTLSPRMAPQSSKFRLEVKMVDLFSYRCRMISKKSSSACGFSARNPISSRIRRSGVRICWMIRRCELSALPCASFSSREWRCEKTTEYPLLAASSPMALARCVFPVPGFPMRIMFLRSSTKRQARISASSFLSSSGWKFRS